MPGSCVIFCVDIFAATFCMLPALIHFRFLKAFASKGFKPFLFFGMDVVFLIPNKLNKMKKINFLIAATLIVTAGVFTACSNSDKDTAKADAENLTQYVDSVENAPRVYTSANWTLIDEGYNARVAKADSASANPLNLRHQTSSIALCPEIVTPRG